jgi:type VI protein secretion system component VasF
MALQMGALRDALIAAGTPVDKAAAAAEEAEEAAAFRTRLGGLDARLAVLTWMAGANVALMLLLLGSTLALWARLDEIGGHLARLAS